MTKQEREAIRERHQKCHQTWADHDYIYLFEDAHVDRAALLAEVDRLNERAETPPGRPL